MNCLGRTFLFVSFALSLLPLSAQADQCSDASANYNRMSPELQASMARILPKLFLDSAEARQKDQCRMDKEMDNIVRTLFNNAKRVGQACAGRVRLKCDLSCWQQTLSESEKKSAYSCDPARLQEVAKAEQAKKDARAACDKVLYSAGGALLDVGGERPNWIKACNNDKDACQMTRRVLTDEKEKVPPDLTCGEVASGPSPGPDVAEEPVIIATDPCNGVALWMMRGGSLEKIPQHVKDCNSLPDRDYCKATRSLIEDNVKRSASVLTCDH